MEENIEELVSQCLAASDGSRAPVYKALIGKFTGSKGSEIKWKSSEETTKKIIKVLKEDIISEDFDTSYEASGLLGCVLAKEEFLDVVDLKVSSSLLTSLLDAIEHHIEKKSDKRILIRGLWSLANSMFKNEVYGDNLKKIFFIINQVLGGHNEISSLAQLETLRAVLQLQDAIHSKMVQNSREYIQPVFRQLFHEGDKVRDVSYRCVYNLKTHMEENPDVTQVLIPELKATYTKKMLRLVSAECSDVLKIWRLIVGLLGKFLHPGTSLINLLLEVVEKAFKSQKSEIRVDAFLCWQALMDNFSIDEKVITNPKRLKLLIAPLKVNNAKTEEIATAKLQAWWHLVVKLDKNAQSNFDLVVAPLLRFCFGGGSSSGVAVGLSDQYLMKAGATSASPGRKFVGLHLLCAEILAQIISKGLDLDNAMSCNMSIKPLTAPVLNSGQGFVHSHPLLFNCIKEAITSLNPNDKKHQILVVFILQCVLGQLKVVLSTEAKSDTVEAVKAAFMLISSLDSGCRSGDSQSFFVYKFLEMVMCGSHTLPRSVLNARQYHIPKGNTMKDMMNGTLCDHIIHQLCTPTMLHYATVNEMYFVIWESVLNNCNPSTGKLGFLQSVVKELDNAAAVLCPAHPATLVRLWGYVATSLVQHIKDTQNIDQGDSNEHDWSCVYSVLFFPLRHSADKLSSAERHHFHQMMKDWTQLWGQFVQLTPIVDTAEPNSEVEDICSKIMDMFKDELTGPPDCHVSALELIADVLHIMISGLRFSELGKTSAKLISSPAKPRKKPHVLKNLASAIEVFNDVFPKVLRMTSDRRQKISTQLINMAVLVFDGIKKKENMIKYLISHTTEVMHKTVQVNLTALFGGDIENKFGDMWSKYCGLIEIQCNIDAEYADEHLIKFAPLFQSSLQSGNKRIKQEMWKLWNSSFASTGASIPSELYAALKVAGLPPASLDDTVAVLEESLSNSPKENVPTHISGSFLNREKGNTGTPKFGTPRTPKTPKGTPKRDSIKLPLEETPKSRRNTLGTTPLSKRKIALQDMKDEEFVLVSSPRSGRRVLTEHQAEKMKERKSDIPALYSDLTQSNSQLPVQFTTQHSLEGSNSTEKSSLKKTEDITNESEEMDFTGKFVKETNSEDPVIEQCQEVKEKNGVKKGRKKSAKAIEKENAKMLEEKNKRELLNEDENAMDIDSNLTISNKEYEKILDNKDIQSNTIENTIDNADKNKSKEIEIEEESKVKNSKKGGKGKSSKSKGKEVLQEIEDKGEDLNSQEKLKENDSIVTEESEISIENNIESEERKKVTRSGKSMSKEEGSIILDNDGQEGNKSKSSGKSNNKLNKDKKDIQSNTIENTKDNADKNKSKEIEIEDESKVKNSLKGRKGRSNKSKGKEVLQEIEDKSGDLKLQEKSKENNSIVTEESDISIENNIESEEGKKVTRSGKSMIKEEGSIILDNEALEVNKSKSSGKSNNKLDKETRKNKKNKSSINENKDKSIEDNDNESSVMRNIRKEKKNDKEKLLENVTGKENWKTKPSEKEGDDDMKSFEDEQKITESENTDHKLIEADDKDQKIVKENYEAKDIKDNSNKLDKNIFKFEELRSPDHRRKTTPSKKSIEDIKKSLKGPRSRNRVQYGEVVVSPSIVKDKKIATDKLSVKLSKSAVKKHLKTNNDFTDSESDSDQEEIPSSQEIEVDTNSSKRSILNITRTPVDHGKGKRKRDVVSGPNEEPKDKKKCLEYSDPIEEVELPNDLDLSKKTVIESQSEDSITIEEKSVEETPIIKKKRGRKSKNIPVNDPTNVGDKINSEQVSKSERSQSYDSLLLNSSQSDCSEDLFKTNSQTCSPKLTRSGRKVKTPNKDMPEPMTPPGKLPSTVTSVSPTSLSKVKRSLSIENPSVQKKITDIFSKEQKDIDSEDSETCHDISIDINKLSAMEDEFEDSCIPMKDESTGESETSEKECEENMKSLEINGKSLSGKSKNVSEKGSNKQSSHIGKDITGSNDKETEAEAEGNEYDGDIQDHSLDTSGFSGLIDMDIKEKAEEKTDKQEKYLDSEIINKIDNLTEFENDDVDTGNCDAQSSDSESEEESNTSSKFSNLKKDADLSSPSGRLNSSKELTLTPQKSPIKVSFLDISEQNVDEIDDEFDIVLDNDDLADRILKRQSLSKSPEGSIYEKKVGNDCDKDSIVTVSKPSSASTVESSSLSSFESGQRIIDETPTPTDFSSSPSSAEPESESSRPKPNISFETTQPHQTEEESSPEKISKSKFSSAVGTPERKKIAGNKFTSSRAAMLVACAKQNIKNRSGEGESPSKVLDIRPYLASSPSLKSGNSPSSRKSLVLSPSNTPSSNRKRKYSDMGSADRRPWAKHKPSPGASPASSILKKRDECLDSSYAETPSPPNKQRRVSFADPPVSEAVEIPPSPKNKGIRAQKRLDMTKAASPEKEPRLYVEINKFNLPEKETQSQTQEDMEAVAFANCSQPFYPNLINCQESIRQIVDELTAPTLVEGLISLMKDKGIITIGDLSRQSEADIHALPLRAPKHTITYSVLKKYDDRIRGTISSTNNTSSSNEKKLCMGPDDPNESSEKSMSSVMGNKSESTNGVAITEGTDEQLVETVLSRLSSKNGKFLLSSIMKNLDHSTVMEVVCSYMNNTTRNNRNGNPR